MDTIKELKQIFVNNQWYIFFDKLQEIDAKSKNEFGNEIAILNARYKAIQKDKMLGLASREDIEIELNKIGQAALFILGEIEKVYKEIEKKETRNWKPEKRLALVIGCGEYDYAGVLKNPTNDANGMVEKLKELSFEVDLLVNPSLRELKIGIDEFGDKLNSFEIGLFFFAGHGVQVNGLNYLIPKDANLKTEKMVEYDCVRASRVLSYMEDAQTNVNILILDACRNNPFERSWNRSIQSRGLASMDAPKGSLIAYSTAPGTVASDGIGDFGLYTEELLQDIVIPNTPINQMFQKVRKKVMEKSNGKQVPWESTSLTDDFYFIRK